MYFFLCFKGFLRERMRQSARVIQGPNKHDRDQGLVSKRFSLCYEHILTYQPEKKQKQFKEMRIPKKKKSPNEVKLLICLKNEH